MRRRVGEWTFVLDANGSGLPHLVHAGLRKERARKNARRQHGENIGHDSCVSGHVARAGLADSTRAINRDSIRVRRAYMAWAWQLVSTPFCAIALPSVQGQTEPRNIAFLQSG